MTVTTQLLNPHALYWTFNGSLVRLHIQYTCWPVAFHFDTEHAFVSAAQYYGSSRTSYDDEIRSEGVESILGEHSIMCFWLAQHRIGAGVNILLLVSEMMEIPIAILSKVLGLLDYFY